jgi:hypothetical protein
MNPAIVIESKSLFIELISKPQSGIARTVIPSFKKQKGNRAESREPTATSAARAAWPPCRLAGAGRYAMPRQLDSGRQRAPLRIPTGMMTLLRPALCRATRPGYRLSKARWCPAPKQRRSAPCGLPGGALT